MPTYHLFKFAPTCLQVQSDYLVAADGVYRILECCGIRIPVPQVSCEIRGLAPLSPWLCDPSSASGGNVSFHLPDAEVLPFGPSYHLLFEGMSLPPIDPSCIYQYVIARAGVFLLAGCPGLAVLLPISRPTLLPGLAPVSPFVVPTYPPVGEAVVQQLLAHALAAHDQNGEPIEQLYFLLWEEGVWRLTIPAQVAGRDSVRACAITAAYLQAALEGHSHHRYRARFSACDDSAEITNGGFRVYFVLGNLFTQPEIRVRICVHGYNWEVPASFFFALPLGIVDCVAQAWQERKELHDAPTL